MDENENENIKRSELSSLAMLFNKEYGCIDRDIECGSSKQLVNLNKITIK